MPVDFSLPPDTRTVGSGNPPQDMDNVVDALTAMGAGRNVLSAAYAGGADPTGVADSSAAFQACMDASKGTASTGGGEMIIPPGTYKCNSTLHINGPMKIRGLGAAIGFSPATGGGPPTTLPAVTITSNNSTALFDFPSQGYLWGGLEMSGIAISFTGTGDVFSNPSLTDSAFRDMTVSLSAAGSRALLVSGSFSLLNVIHERCHFITTAATRTQPMISVSSSIGAAISNNTFFKCKFNNQGLDTSQYMVFFSCTGTGSAFHFADNFIECWFEHPFGGAYKSLSGSNIKIDGCICWDTQTGQAGNPVPGNSLWYHGAAASNAGSQGISITNCGRNLNGPNPANTPATWDVECESTTSNVLISGYMTSPVNPSTNYPVFFNFHNCLDVTLINNQSPQGASVNGNSNTVVTNPPLQMVNLTQGTVTSQQWQPSDSQYLATNFDPALVSVSQALTTGKVYLCRIHLANGAAVTNIKVFVKTAGSGLTSGQNFLGLYDASGNRIAISADQTTNWGSSNTAPSVALVGGPYSLGAGYYYVAMLSNASTTGVGLGASSGNNQNSTILNGPVAAANFRYASYPTGSQTSLPAGPITMSSNNSEQLTFWAALL